MYVIEFVEVTLFVASTGVFFSERFRRNRVLVFCAGAIAIVFTYLPTEQFVRHIVHQVMREQSLVNEPASDTRASVDQSAPALQEEQLVPQPSAAPTGTLVNNQAAFDRLMNASGLSLQWVSWDYLGRLRVSRDERGFVHLSGNQGDPANGMAITLSGVVLEINERSFRFRGDITIVDTGSESYGVTSPCTRSGEFTFRHFPPRQYWRLREQQHPCRGILTDYVDIHF